MDKFKTIKEAFANGTGDVFYRKGNEFVAIDRNNEAGALDLQAEGFTRLKHSEVVDIATDQTLAYFAKILTGVVAIIVTDTISEEEALIRKQKAQN